VVWLLDEDMLRWKMLESMMTGVCPRMAYIYPLDDGGRRVVYWAEGIVKHCVVSGFRAK
jgi:hypothetical protein